MSKLEDVIFETLVDHSLNTDQKGEQLAEYFGDLLGSMQDVTPCSFDHHGGCQAHGYLSLEAGEKCPQMEIKELLS